MIDGKKLVFVPILRAGTGLLDGFLAVIPGARVGHVGMYRNPVTLQPVEYYFKMPSGMPERDAIVLDPMLATGNSAVLAVARLKHEQPRSIRLVCLVAAPEGVEDVHRRASRCPDLHGGDRSPAERPRLHPAGTGRRGGPHLRHQVTSDARSVVIPAEVAIRQGRHPREGGDPASFIEHA